MECPIWPWIWHISIISISIDMAPFDLSRLFFGRVKEIYKPGVETELVNRPPIGLHTFSSDMISQRMPQVPASA